MDEAFTVVPVEALRSREKQDPFTWCHVDGEILRGSTVIAEYGAGWEPERPGCKLNLVIYLAYFGEHKLHRIESFFFNVFRNAAGQIMMQLDGNSTKYTEDHIDSHPACLCARTLAQRVLAEDPYIDAYLCNQPESLPPWDPECRYKAPPEPPPPPIVRASARHYANATDAQLSTAFAALVKSPLTAPRFLSPIAQPPTAASIERINRELGVTLPPSFVAFSQTCPENGLFASLDENDDNPYHILSINRSFHDTSGEGWIPRWLVLFEFVYDGDCIGFDTRVWDATTGEYPIMYWHYDTGHYFVPSDYGEYPGFPDYLDHLLNNYAQANPDRDGAIIAKALALDQQPN